MTVRAIILILVLLWGATRSSPTTLDLQGRSDDRDLLTCGRGEAVPIPGVRATGLLRLLDTCRPQSLPGGSRPGPLHLVTVRAPAPAAPPAGARPGTVDRAPAFFDLAVPGNPRAPPAPSRA